MNLSTTEFKSKTCDKCNKSFPFECYSEDKNSEDRLWKYCKSCVMKSCGKLAKPKIYKIKPNKLVKLNKPQKLSKKVIRYLEIIKDETKKCSKCELFLPFTDFHKSKNDLAGLSSICKGCSSNYTNTIMDTGLTRAREKHIKNKYNLEIEEYLKMIEDQDNKCKICGKPEVFTSSKGNVKSLAIDHHHESGRVRGLLCQKCNSAIGMLMDDIQLLESAIEYLKNN